MMAKGLPDEFLPAEKRHALYEGIEYQEFWDNPHLRRQGVLEQEIISGFLPSSGRRILDLGCGYGRLAPCYLERFDQVVLCDGSLSLLQEARETLGSRVVLVVADLAKLPFKPASFDCVLTIRVLHHIENLRSALAEIRRIMGHDGALVFSYHNKRNAKWIARYFAARGDANPFSPEQIERIPTLISRHPDVFDAAVKEAGFSSPECRGAVVVDLLASVGESLGKQGPSGLAWADFMGRSRLAPWLVGRSYAQDGPALRSANSIDELLQCPLCRGALDRKDEGFDCPSCERTYPVDDGIMDFRP